MRDIKKCREFVLKKNSFVSALSSSTALALVYINPRRSSDNVQAASVTCPKVRVDLTLWIFRHLRWFGSWCDATVSSPRPSLTGARRKLSTTSLFETHKVLKESAPFLDDPIGMSCLKACEEGLFELLEGCCRGNLLVPVFNPLHSIKRDLLFSGGRLLWQRSSNNEFELKKLSSYQINIMF